MIRPGRAAPLGATADRDGVNFALWSSVASAVELCLLDEQGRTTATHYLPACENDVWNGFLPGLRAGQRYGYRVHGEWNPSRGHRCNPHKLLLDPYARQIDGRIKWGAAVFDYVRGKPERPSDHDSAGSVPVGVVRDDEDALPRGPGPRWAETIFYEVNVRGYTMRHPALGEAERGRFAGLGHAEVIAYLKALGVTSIEILPAHAFIDEHHLARRGLRNFWGYNPIAYFAPEPRYAQTDAVGEFRDMVNALHDAGLEVILDVVYNHTGESGSRGPTLGFRGIDNLAYYSTEPDDPGAYINDTGCGNTLNADHPAVQNLVLDSLSYWHRTMGVDGFRFDLATVLGRHNHGFSAEHPLLAAIGTDPRLADARLVAEPWDPGPGGYQLGAFPQPWAEWNDRYRDAVRRFWRGDAGAAAGMARGLRGSAEIFEPTGRKPVASVNLVTSHDGFTLADVVSYEQRHNEANGERNRDGHAHNYSRNYGVEGPTDDPEILNLRRRQRLNMLATLLLSQGTPLILGGDEFGNSQQGNNNAYAQDNDTGWTDWSGAAADPDFVAAVRTLVELRKTTPLLHLPEYVHGHLQAGDSDITIEWLRPAGDPMQPEDWDASRAFTLLVREQRDAETIAAAALLFNAGDEAQRFRLPGPDGSGGDTGGPEIAFSSAAVTEATADGLSLPSFSIACLRLSPPPGAGASGAAKIAAAEVS